MFSVVVSADNLVSKSALQDTLQSLIAQDWNNLEVLVIVGGQTVTVNGANFASFRGISIAQDLTTASFFLNGPSAAGLRGDYIIQVPAGSIFEPSAFSTLNRFIGETDARRRPDFIIFDHENKGSKKGLPTPAFLPGWDPDFFEQVDYIGNAAAVRSDYFDTAAISHAPNSMRTLLLAAVRANADSRVSHIREMLLQISGGRPAISVAPHAVKPASASKKSTIAVIIPNRNKAGLLAQCVSSIAHDKLVTELIIVDNGSDDPATLKLYKKLVRSHGAKIVEINQPFNFSRMINAGVKASDSDVLLLLNNDIEFKHPGVLRQALDFAVRPEIGIVGSKLLYPDGTVQHAGVLLEYHPRECLVRAMHVGRGSAARSPGYLGQNACTRNYQAVTGAFMMIRREVFEEVGGFDEVALPIEFNDVDFCLRVREAGYKIVCLPLDGVVHHESASRGKVDSLQVQRMRLDAQALMARRWLPHFQNDPYNHPIARIGDKAEVVFNFTGEFIG